MIRAYFLTKIKKNKENEKKSIFREIVKKWEIFWRFYIKFLTLSHISFDGKQMVFNV